MKNSNIELIYEIAKTCFSIKGDPEIRLEQDPEDGEEYIRITIRVIGTVDEVFEANEKFIEKTFTLNNVSKIRLIPVIIGEIK